MKCANSTARPPALPLEPTVQRKADQKQVADISPFERLPLKILKKILVLACPLSNSSEKRKDEIWHATPQLYRSKLSIAKHHFSEMLSQCKVNKNLFLSPTQYAAMQADAVLLGKKAVACLDDVGPPGVDKALMFWEQKEYQLGTDAKALHVARDGMNSAYTTDSNLLAADMSDMLVEAIPLDILSRFPSLGTLAINKTQYNRLAPEYQKAVMWGCIPHLEIVNKGNYDFNSLRIGFMWSLPKNEIPLQRFCNKLVADQKNWTLGDRSHLNNLICEIRWAMDKNERFNQQVKDFLNHTEEVKSSTKLRLIVNQLADIHCFFKAQIDADLYQFSLYVKRAHQLNNARQCANQFILQNASHVAVQDDIRLAYELNLEKSLHLPILRSELCTEYLKRVDVTSEDLDLAKKTALHASTNPVQIKEAFSRMLTQRRRLYS